MYQDQAPARQFNRTIQIRNAVMVCGIISLRQTLKTARMPMTKEELLAYIAAHEAANALEIQELRSMSIEEKFRQTAALMAAAREMGWFDALSAEDAYVRELWIRLKKAYSGGG